MIFSLLKIRKKTAGILAGITIAALSLWGLSFWQNITLLEILNILGGTLAMLAAIVTGAFLLISFLKLVLRAWEYKKLGKSEKE
ncbi:hypothetical protein N9478_07965 [Gammaproteobacteria bacterium]|nr:hypothetical protein [Gammaproteobacteria bacterium]